MVGAPSDEWLRRHANTLDAQSRKRDTIALNRLRRAFDEVAPTYDDVADGTEVARVEDEWLRDRFMFSAARFHDPRIIDFACGTGWMLDHVDVDPARYIGVDLSEGMIARAKQKHPSHRFMAADMHRTWLRPAEVAFMGFDTINLSPTPALMVASLHRQLRPAGLAFVVFVTPEHRDAECACHSYTPADLRHWYTPDEAIAMFSGGFDRITTTPLPSPPPHEGSYFVLEATRRVYMDVEGGPSSR
jgi:SAM-dependent methyltransferase